jgi:hypothetical protein
MTPLTVAVLAMEARAPRRSGVKEQAVHDLFGVLATTYYAAVNRLIDDPEALQLDPVTVNRLRRLRERRRLARSA